ncbi:MAG: hypothetical protein PVI80_19760 [Anaerolineae bacterium]
MNNNTKLERMNYFTGLFTTASDWEAEQAYHRRKLRLHERWLHNTPGIVGGVGEELQVVAAGGLTVRVMPGAAMDGLGREIYLTEACEVELGGEPPVTQAKKGKKAKTAIGVYITIQYNEEEDRHIDNVEQPQYSGFSRVVERPRVKIGLDQPDGQAQLELARVDLQAGATEILDAQDPDNPQANEIDRRYVPWAVSTGQQRDQIADLQERLGQEEEKSAGFQESLERLDREHLLHSRGLHTPGIVLDEGDEWAVKAAGGLDVEVGPGAALDGDGQTLILDERRLVRIVPDDYELPQLVFIAVAHAGSGGAPGIRLKASAAKPDNRNWLELARIDLQPDVTEILDAEDPDHPRGNEINCLHVAQAGAVRPAEKRMEAGTVERLSQVMRRTRREFAALVDQFPVPSAMDVRHAALTVETLACTNLLRPGQLPDVLAATVALEQDVGQEIEDKYGNVVDTAPEFAQYQAAVRDLLAALPSGDETGILNAQDAVAEAARELSELVVQTPIADAGRDRKTATLEDETTVSLDGSRSQARGGREVVRYRWSKEG